jgi:hypothetical protein
MFTTQQGGADYLDYVEEPYDPALPTVIPFSSLSHISRFQLTGDPGGDSAPVWAPFGDQIAFVRAIAGNADIWVMSADGTNAQRLTSQPGPDTNPSWQPAQESSADVVGGHTYPGPVTRTPHGGSGDGAGGGSAGGGSGGGGGSHSGTRRSPRLAILRARWHGGRVIIAGRAAQALRGRVRLSFACGPRHSQHTARRVRARSGRFGGTMTVPRGCRRARRGVVGATYGGDARYKRQRITSRVRRR